MCFSNRNFVAARAVVISYYRDQNPDFDISKLEKLVTAHEGKEVFFSLSHAHEPLNVLSHQWFKSSTLQNLLFQKLEEKYGQPVPTSDAFR